MTIELKLDTAAVASLFPEGSDARLHLQQAVINETVRNLIDRNLSSLRYSISEQVRKAFEEALAKEGLANKFAQGLTLSDAAKARIAERAREEFGAAISKAVNEAAAPAIADLDRRLKGSLDDGLRIRLNAMAKDALREALK